jgi:hypothetical protein
VARESTVSGTTNRTARRFDVGRRDFLIAAAGLASLPLVGCGSSSDAAVTSTAAGSGVAPEIGRRRLGALEVSSLGLGCQNMSRTYQGTVPDRREQLRILRTAFERGVTFYDAAEAYGPHEVERILGEGVAPFRDQVVLATKFGWNIDLETGERRPGLDSRPEHIELVVEGMLRRLRTDRIDLLYQHRVVGAEVRQACSWRSAGRVEEPCLAGVVDPRLERGAGRARSIDGFDVPVDDLSRRLRRPRLGRRPSTCSSTGPRRREGSREAAGGVRLRVKSSRYRGGGVASVTRNRPARGVARGPPGKSSCRC